jgi:acyl dehydratase
MTEIHDFSTLQQRLGKEIAISDWFEVPQDRITQFAETTEDRQWIHLDPARAAAESPYRTTIAHGFLTLSMVSALLRNAIKLPAQRMGINYGLNRVRFMAAVPSGSRIRGRFVPTEVKEIEGGYQVVWTITIEREGSERPCCVAEWIIRYIVDGTRGSGLGTRDQQA